MKLLYTHTRTHTHMHTHTHTHIHMHICANVCVLRDAVHDLVPTASTCVFLTHYRLLCRT